MLWPLREVLSILWPEIMPLQSAISHIPTGISWFVAEKKKKKKHACTRTHMTGKCVWIIREQHLPQSNSDILRSDVCVAEGLINYFDPVRRWKRQKRQASDTIWCQIGGVIQMSQVWFGKMRNNKRQLRVEELKDELKKKKTLLQPSPKKCVCFFFSPDQTQ